MFQAHFTDKDYDSPARLEGELEIPQDRGQEKDVPSLNQAPSWLRCLLNDVGFGILILDPDLKVCFCNDIASTALEGAGFGYLTQAAVPIAKSAEGRDPADIKKFLSFAKLAVKGQRKLLLLGQDDHQIAVALSPISLCEGFEQNGVLVTTERKTVCETLSLWAYGRVQGLTAGELKVLHSLATGHEPKVVAESLRISVTTVRTHIKSILNKTDEPSIRGLLLRVAKLPPIRTLPC
jgi:DNA-binding CsgD family transcriptional regulator